MRAREVFNENDLSANANAMLMKLRKGMAASLNAARFAEILPVLPGWKIEKDKQWRLSEGGWVLGEIEGGLVKKFYSYRGKSNGAGLINLETASPRDLASYPDWGGGEEKRKELYAQDVAKSEALQNVAKKLAAIQGVPQNKKWMVKDVEVSEQKVPEYNDGLYLTVSFELYVMTSGFKITSPDGQTYDIYGDYKNGAIDPHTFETFFKWADANTDIMSQILAALNMEAHEPKHDPKTKWTPPPTSSKETQGIFEVLKTMTKDVRDEQKTELLTVVVSGFEGFLAAIKAGNEKQADSFKRGFAGFVISRNYNPKTGKVSDDWREQADKFCDDAVNEMQNMFVYKNTGKLAPILTAKGALGNPEAISIDASRGIITAEMKFTFDDGSSFYVHQSIVRSYASDSWGNITDFYRFPTTFHDVKLPGGVKMGLPSEQRMNEIFATA